MAEGGEDAVDNLLRKASLQAKAYKHQNMHLDKTQIPGFQANESLTSHEIYSGTSGLNDVF